MFLDICHTQVDGVHEEVELESYLRWVAAAHDIVDYARLYVDTITASIRGTTRPGKSYASPANSPIYSRLQGDGAPALQMHAQRSAMADLSLLAFSALSSDITEHRVLPVLITDPTLPEQYSEEHDAPPSLSKGLSLRRRATDLPSTPSHN